MGTLSAKIKSSIKQCEHSLHGHTYSIKLTVVSRLDFIIISRSLS
jgi:6-pyruvoyl-tetrahydropterin synthase